VRKHKNFIMPITGLVFGLGVGQVLQHRPIVGLIFMSVAYVATLVVIAFL
jgi:hypothetical protein